MMFSFKYTQPATLIRRTTLPNSSSISLYRSERAGRNERGLVGLAYLQGIATNIEVLGGRRGGASRNVCDQPVPQ